MFELLVILLICYGFVLIITRGSIFQGPREFINDKFVKSEKWFFIDRNTAIELLAEESVDIDKKYIDLYKKILPAVENPEYPNLFNDLINKIHENIINRRNKNYFLKKIFTFWLLKLINKLINCQMCLGFWAGILISVITIYYPIVLFGSNIQVVINFNYLSIFVFGLISSGTVWAIDQIVEYFSNNQK
jgi:hypothetical protein